MRAMFIWGALTLGIASSLQAAEAVDGPAPAPTVARFEKFSYQGKAQENVRARDGEFVNPILSGYYPDPSITRVGDDYYLVNSSFTNFPGLPLFHSKDLVNWTQIGNALDRPGQVDFTGVVASQGIYAPDISYHDGLFHIITTCSSCPGGTGSFVITAKNPAGPWSQPVTIRGLQGIDPSLVWDGDKLYVVYNNAPEGKPRYEGHRAIWMAELDPRTLQFAGKPKVLVDGGVVPEKRPIWIEGPHIFKKDGYYYLICAEGGTADDHSEVVFRADAVTGPYVPAPVNPILTQRDLDPKRAHPVTSAGHADFVQTQNGQWWAVFLATRPYPGNFYNIGRETFLLPVAWKDGWPQILPQGKPVPFVAARPDLPAQPQAPVRTSGNFAYVDKFDGPLSAAWIGIRIPHAPLYTIEHGELVLRPAGHLGDLRTAPAFVGRRQQHHVATVSTVVDFVPRQDGDRAGLVAMQNDSNHMFLGLARIDGKDVVALYKTERGRETLVANRPAASTRIELVMDMDGGQATYRYRDGNVTTTLASNVDIRFLSTQKAGGFVGTVIGPYVQSAPDTAVSH
jgi:alpha-N-arabinofuranosidase